MLIQIDNVLQDRRFTKYSQKNTLYRDITDIDIKYSCSLYIYFVSGKMSYLDPVARTFVKFN